MKIIVVSLGRMAVILLLLAGLSMCVMPDQSASSPPEEALSFDELLASLDELQGPATQSMSMPGQSVFALSGGASFSTVDLLSYLNAIKRDFANYVYACAGGKPYLVLPVKLSLPGSNSGLMWVPFTWGRSLPAPIISFQHGTQIYGECAPSRFNPSPLRVRSCLAMAPPTSRGSCSTR